MSEGTTPAGWYPDRDDPSRLRWWDGERWTGHSRPLGSPDERWQAGEVAAAGRWAAPDHQPARGPASGLRTVVVVLILVTIVGVGGLWLASVVEDTGPTPPGRDELGDLALFLCDDRTCPAVTAGELADLGVAIAADPDVESFHFESKEQAYEWFSEEFADAPALVERFGPEDFPASFRLWLAPHAAPEEVADRYEGWPGVEEAHVPRDPDPWEDWTADQDQALPSP